MWPSAGKTPPPQVGHALIQLLPPPPRRWEVWPHPTVGGRLWEDQGLWDWGRGGGRPAQTLLLPFYGLTVSEAALTRTSAIRLPRAWDRKREGGGQGAGLGGAVGEESPPGRG